MPHIHTKPGQHDHTASAFIVSYIDDEPKLLLHMHKKLHRLMQPGGHIELDETPWQAVLREIYEETGYEPSQLKVLLPQERLQTFSDESQLHPLPITHSTHRYSDDLEHYHTDSNYLFVTHELPRGLPMDKESNNLQWLSEQELRDLAPDMTFENIREIGLFVFSGPLEHWERVPVQNFKA